MTQPKTQTQQEPRIIAECWTCAPECEGTDTFPVCPWCEIGTRVQGTRHPLQLTQPRADYHRIHDHDVRPVQVKP